MFRISLRELLILVAAVALAIVSLKTESTFLRGIIELLAMLALGLAVIAAILDRGRRQAIAIGAAVMMSGYAGLILVHNFADDDPMPTTSLLISVHGWVAHSGWVDAATREDVAIDGQSLTLHPNGANMFNGRPVEWVERPPLTDFLATAQCWLLLLLGYIGGHFARFVYIRRCKEMAPSAPQSTPSANLAANPGVTGSRPPRSATMAETDLSRR
jgi:hypothetical protein